MLLEIDAGCFRSTTDLRLILSLIHLIQSERHDWIPTREAALAADDYFNSKLGEGKHQSPEYPLVKKYLEASSYPRGETGAKPVQVIAEHLDDLVHDLGRPVAVIVENRFNDGECLLFQARLFQRDRIVRAEREGWMEFCNSGGSGDIRKHGVDQQGRFRRLVRVVLVVDGDVVVPGATSTKVADLSVLRGLNVLVFVWPGRELENFLPVRVLVVGRGRKAETWAAAVRALSWPQRAHFDTKNGLNRDTKNVDELAFHSTFDTNHRTVLTGRGYKIPRYEKMRAMSASDEDLTDLPPEAHKAIQEMLDLIESVL